MSFRRDLLNISNSVLMAGCENISGTGLDEITSPIICGYCKTAFRSFEKFYRHLKLHNVCINELFHVCETENTVSEKDLENDQTFTCTRCSRKFSTICQLHDHLLNCADGGSYIYIYNDKQKLAHPLTSLCDFVDKRNEWTDTEVDIESTTETNGNIKKDICEIVESLWLNYGKTNKLLNERLKVGKLKDASTDTTDLELANVKQTGLEIRLNTRTVASNETHTSSNKADETLYLGKVKNSIEDVQADNCSKYNLRNESNNDLKCDISNDSNCLNSVKDSESTAIGGDETPIYEDSDEMEDIVSNDKTKGEGKNDLHGIRMPFKNLNKTKILKKKQFGQVNGHGAKKESVKNTKKLQKTKPYKKEINTQQILEPPVKKKRGRKSKVSPQTLEPLIKTKRERKIKIVQQPFETHDKKKRGRKKLDREVCKICGKHVERCRLKVHEISHTDERPYQCELCPKTYKYPLHLAVHMKSHSDVLPYYCEVCGQGFIDANRLKRHAIMHTDFRPYTCELCGAGFTTKYKLNRHMFVHTGAKKMQCDLCGMIFAHKDSLSTHISGIHKRERRFSCQDCDKTFFTNYQLKCHAMKHSGLRPHKCTLCKADFIERKELRRHMMKQHRMPLEGTKGPDMMKLDHQVDTISVESNHKTAIFTSSSKPGIENITSPQTLSGFIDNTQDEYNKVGTEQSRTAETGNQVYEETAVISSQINDNTSEISPVANKTTLDENLKARHFIATGHFITTGMPNSIDSFHPVVPGNMSKVYLMPMSQAGVGEQSSAVSAGLSDKVVINLKHLTTRTELEHFNTRTELEHMNTRTELGHLNTRTELEHLNTRTELGQLNTRTELEHLNSRTEFVQKVVSSSTNDECYSPNFTAL